jgi:molecular chaperone HtpG
LWLRDKKDISEEEYKEFYKQTSSMADDPFFIIHNKVEGTLEYSNLLFIPSKKPFDLYSPEKKTSVKLYANRVFITENNTEILPEYLRFVKGVVDSPDLPLNISRETFQKNDHINKIRNSLIKKIFSELKKKQTEDRQKYIQFWEVFSNVIKEGLCDYVSDKEQIIDVCLFRTTKSGDDYITIDEYVDRMKSDQKYIYYITGDDYKDLVNNPQLEAFKKNDIEVLLLTDSVDDFWINVVIDHKGKDMKSISSKDVKADEYDEKVKTKESEEKDDKIIEIFKEALGERVKLVKTTDKLVDSPACLSTEHGAMTIRMEKYLYENKQLPRMSPKVLEINPDHPIILGVYDRYVSSQNKISQKDLDLINIIYDLACLTGGDFVQTPNEFAKKVFEAINTVA